MENKEHDKKLITETIQLYFDGTYYGQKDKLKKAFHSEAHITGTINDQIFDWTLDDFITRVTAIPTASDKKETYDKAIIFIDITHNAAIVKTRVLVGDLVFIDYITLLKINNQWLIRNKSFTT